MKLITPRELKELGVLGMNARNIDYIAKYNRRKYYPLVDDKLKTKQGAISLGMNVPELYGTIDVQHQIHQLGKILEGRDSFVIKPAQGSGGKGILVIFRRDGNVFHKISGGDMDYLDVQRHVSNIISGLYSLGGRPDVAMLEALINFDNRLMEYSYEGVPDIRVIVFKGVPVMAMLRCATHSSGGKANLHQGAVGVGVDIVTGKCETAIQKGIAIEKHPDTGHIFNDLMIPEWQTILEVATRCYEISKLGYFGADIVLDKNLGPTILELNARPGLAIQIANQMGLMNRLKAVEPHDTRGLDYHARIALMHRIFG